MDAVDPRVDKLYTDMYLGEGSGNPPMTVRVDRLEKWAGEMVENSKKTRDYARNTWVTIFAAIVSAFIVFKMGWMK